jgi:hypothetical protein
MTPEIADNRKRRYRIVANVGAFLTAFWLLAYVAPVGRALMLDTVLSLLLGLMIIGLLWWATRCSIRPRRFWAALTAAWIIGLLGNIAWGLYEQITRVPLPTISLVDAMYLARYALILAAYWYFLCPPSRRQWMRLLLVLLVAVALTGAEFFLTSSPLGRTFLFWAWAVYPILDAGLIYVGLSAWRREPPGHLRNALGLLGLALVAYGLANWLNFYGHMISYDTVLSLANLFWPLSDVLASLGVLHVLWMTPPTAIDEGDLHHEQQN